MRGLEPRELDLHGIETRLHVAQPEAAAFIGGGDLRRRGGDVRHRHRRARDDLLLCVRDFTDQGGGSGLGMRGASRDAGQQQRHKRRAVHAGSRHLRGFVTASSREEAIQGSSSLPQACQSRKTAISHFAVRA